MLIGSVTNASEGAAESELRELVFSEGRDGGVGGVVGFMTCVRDDS